MRGKGSRGCLAKLGSVAKSPRRRQPLSWGEKELVCCGMGGKQQAGTVQAEEVVMCVSYWTFSVSEHRMHLGGRRQAEKAHKDQL